MMMQGIAMQGSVTSPIKLACQGVAKWLLLALGVIVLLASASLAQAAALAVGEGRLVRIAEGEVGTVFIADPEIADIQIPSDNAVLLLGRRTGTTTLYVLDIEGNPLLQQRVVVQHNLTELQSVLRQRFPALRLTLESAPGSLLISGGVPDAQTTEAIARTIRPYLGQGEELINQMSLASPVQVHLRVRVTEVSRAVTQKLGVNWSTILSPGSFTAGVVSGRPFHSIVNTFSESAGRTRTIVDGVESVVRNNAWNSSYGRSSNYSPSPDGGFSFLGGYSHSNHSIQAMIDVLDREGLISILAEPNLTAVSGQTASFLAGGEFPVPVKQDADTMTVEFKPFGVSLDFTPTVMADDRISISVRPEISEIDLNSSIQMEGLIIPGLSVRRVETTVEMASGQSFAIGGLLQNNIRDLVSKVPGLGAVPVLGQLFTSTDYQNNKSELVVIVTPYLVRPTDGSRLASPLDSMRPATDIEYILHDKIGLDPLLGNIPRLTGQAGFVY